MRKGRKPKILPTDQVMILVGYIGFTMQKPEAQALLMACFAEALERRADKAFGVKREEEEYNAKLSERQQGILARNSYTDVIKAYLDAHPEVQGKKR
ncbi:MAG: hypothetical protein F6K53_20225 [Moorea sp. SIO4A1]|uniref:hypothetical protein n=1 Tax=Moorena sp. SIO4A1 TaxID=2607835 RepID=UPI00144DDB3F|nr:hypothetical protein [Moorena sp. SIO4A1]NEQ59599.1 hypothetical protein [Moorena sp. SIO4A1]